MTRVWIFDLQRHAADAIHLAPEEYRRAAAFRFAADRRRFTVGRTLLRRLLAATLKTNADAIIFATDAHGKPQLEGIEFNVSHSGDRIMIAISDVPVGVDVEQINGRVKTTEIAARYFNRAECAWIDTQPDPREAFFRMWAMKESVMKADGRGMSLHLHAIIVDPERHCAIADGTPWQLTELDAGAAYRACVATPPGCVIELGTSEPQRDRF